MTCTPAPAGRVPRTMSRRTRSRGLGVGATAGLLMLLAVAPAHGHAHLLDTTPAEGAELDGQPDQVILTFDEAVEPAGGPLVLTDGGGTAHDLEAAVGPDTGQISAEVPTEVASGEHTVAWRIVAADGHVQEGEFSYTVAATAEDAGEDTKAAEDTDAVEDAGPDDAAEPDDAGDDPAPADEASEAEQDLGADATGAPGEDEGGTGWLVAVTVLVAAAAIAGALLLSGRRRSSAEGEA